VIFNTNYKSAEPLESLVMLSYSMLCYVRRRLTNKDEWAIRFV